MTQEAIPKKCNDCEFLSAGGRCQNVFSKFYASKCSGCVACNLWRPK